MQTIFIFLKNLLISYAEHVNETLQQIQNNYFIAKIIFYTTALMFNTNNFKSFTGFWTTQFSYSIANIWYIIYWHGNYTYIVHFCFVWLHFKSLTDGHLQKISWIYHCQWYIYYNDPCLYFIKVILNNSVSKTFKSKIFFYLLTT